MKIGDRPPLLNALSLSLSLSLFLSRVPILSTLSGSLALAKFGLGACQ